MGKTNGSFSFRAADAVEGGGESLANITEIGFVQEFTYGGRYKDKPACALRTVFAIDGMDRPWEDHWPLGPSDNFEVSDDGYSVTATGRSSGLNNKSGGFFFLNELEAALDAQGLDIEDYAPQDEGTLSVEALEGLRVRLVNKPFENVSGDKKDKKVIAAIVTDDEPKKGAGKSSTKNGSAKSGRSSSESIEEKTVKAIKALFDDDTTRIKKADLANEVYAANKKDADVKAMMQLCLKDSWIAGLEDEGIVFDKKKGVVTLAD